MQARKKKRN